MEVTDAPFYRAKAWHQDHLLHLHFANLPSHERCIPRAQAKVASRIQSFDKAVLKVVLKAFEERFSLVEGFIGSLESHQKNTKSTLVTGPSSIRIEIANHNYFRILFNSIAELNRPC